MANKNTPAPAVDYAYVNQQQRAAVLAMAINQELQILATRYTPPNTGALGQTINVPLRNVGLVTKFTVLVRAKVRGVAGEVHTLQPFGPANFFSNVTLTDLQNQTRINTTGWHLHYVASARDAAVFGGAYQNDSPTMLGNNNLVIAAPATMTGTAQRDLYMAYEIPVAYSDRDLRGAIYANVLNATWNLSLTVNPNMFVASTANGVGAVYKSSSAVLGVLDYWDIEVYQHFKEQLPVDSRNGQIILPVLDLGVMYRLENTVMTGLVANQELSQGFGNNRQFLSTFAVYDNSGVLNPGTDVNYFAMQTANTTLLFKRTPHMLALQHRKRLGDDFPPGVYYFDHRERPVETAQYGNVQLSVSLASATSANSVILLGYEYFAELGMVMNAGAIAN